MGEGIKYEKVVRWNWGDLGKIWLIAITFPFWIREVSYEKKGGHKTEQIF